MRSRFYNPLTDPRKNLIFSTLRSLIVKLKYLIIWKELFKTELYALRLMAVGDIKRHSCTYKILYQVNIGFHEFIIFVFYEFVSVSPSIFFSAFLHEVMIQKIHKSDGADFLKKKNLFRIFGLKINIFEVISMSVH